MPEPSIDSMTLRHTTNNGRGSGSPEIPQRVPDAGLAMQGRAVERGQMQQFAIVAPKAQLDTGGGDFDELRDRRGPPPRREFFPNRSKRSRRQYNPTQNPVAFPLLSEHGGWLHRASLAAPPQQFAAGPMILHRSSTDSAEAGAPKRSAASAAQVIVRIVCPRLPSISRQPACHYHGQPLPRF